MANFRELSVTVCFHVDRKADKLAHLSLFALSAPRIEYLPFFCSQGAEYFMKPKTFVIRVIQYKIVPTYSLGTYIGYKKDNYKSASRSGDIFMTNLGTIIIIIEYLQNVRNFYQIFCCLLLFESDSFLRVFF